MYILHFVCWGQTASLHGFHGISGGGSTLLSRHRKQLNAHKVQTLLQQMQDKFQTMSDQIIGRIDEMSGRIDDLEKNIGDLMTQAGVEEMEAENKVKEEQGSA
ncbi:hypothetical protein J4Q44_G00348750 [Coregonus suidteri]|uniref:Heat shock factor-binding protein 1 n=1 Tax=Coregonus suidteri TaxID=861788 RepID=A0AAN8KRH5_9TELE